jgi:hypothetical protein
MWTQNVVAAGDSVNRGQRLQRERPCTCWADGCTTWASTPYEVCTLGLAMGMHFHEYRKTPHLPVLAHTILGLLILCFYYRKKGIQ